MNKLSLNKILIGVLIVVLVLLMYEIYHSKNLENKLALESQDKAALLDTVRVMKTKNGELESAKMVLSGSVNDLKKMSADLSKELKIEQGKVKLITKIELVYKDKPESTSTTVTMHDSAGSIRTDLEDSCRIFKGHVSFILSKGILKTPAFVVEKDEFNLNLITGLRERDSKLEIFVRSSCPNVSIQNIQGAVIDPNDPLIKPKKPFFTWWDALEISGGIALGFIARGL